MSERNAGLLPNDIVWQIKETFLPEMLSAIKSVSEQG
jgi:hypothetical protein